MASVKNIYLLILLSLTSAVSCGKDVGNSLGGSSIGVDQVIISASDISLFTGKKIQLNSSVIPSDVKNPGIRWITSDSSVVTVSNSGLLTGISAGTAVVTAIALDDEKKTAQCNVTVSALPLFLETVNGNGIMYTLPGGTIFKTVITPDTVEGSRFPVSDDDETRGYPVPQKFGIAETETTYALWKEVYDWATDSERGDKIYHFANAGIKGGNRGGTSDFTDKHPVTSVTWRDAIVWCNALTEYYNASNGIADDYECIYTYTGSIIRDSRDSAAVACDNADQKADSKGFRLPSIFEWEFAERYIGSSLPAHSNYIYRDGLYYTKSQSVSGYTGIDGYVDEYGVINNRTTSDVAAKKPNALGLYDMSGNVWEWCFDASMILDGCTTRYLLGGSFRDSLAAAYVGVESEDYPYSVDLSYGFRLSRNGN